MPGQYHFRFQYAYQSSSCRVWLDLPSEQSMVPVFDGEIRIKATRISWNEFAETRHHKVELPVQEVRNQDQIIFRNDAQRKHEHGGSKAGSSIGSMLSDGFMKARNVFGGMASSVQSTVNSTYNEPPSNQPRPQQHPNQPAQASVPPHQKPSFDQLFN